MSGAQKPIDLKEVEEIWQNHWQDSLSIWSRYVRLKDPIFCHTLHEEKRAGLSSSFAMIRLNDHSVVISLKQISELGLQDYYQEILGHEIGHHIYCPADLTDMAKMIARIRRGLPTKESHAGFIGNLYSDLLINDRLFREHNLKMDKIYEILNVQSKDKLWNFYMRIYEILWSLPGGTLTRIKITEEMEADAQLGNRVIRNYSRDWLKGAGRFAALCLTYLLESGTSPYQEKISKLMDTECMGEGNEIPEGLSEIEEDEISGAIHPSYEKENENKKISDKNGNTEQSIGSYREPFEYGQILKSLGINLSEMEIANRYYRERALPYLIPFPTIEKPRSQDPLPEGLNIWDIGSSMEDINWIETATRSPVIIPGYTVFEQVYGISEGNEPKKEPIDLDLYVDCSGSMPNPTINVSYLTLAGAIIALSALRVGARVQATLWSGTNEFETTNGFVSDEKKILSILTGYFGGGTAFPIHILRDTFSERKKNQRKVHILVISDDGVTTIFDKDEKNNSGKDIARMAIEKAGGGGTFVLNLYSDWKNTKDLVFASKLGFEISSIRSWPDLVDFSKNFAKKHYGKKDKN